MILDYTRDDLFDLVSEIQKMKIHPALKLACMRGLLMLYEGDKADAAKRGKCGEKES